MSLDDTAGGPRSGSLVRQAMRAITGHIRTEGLRVGDSLPGEWHFANQLGVSRAVMREAFGALSALNLIEVANGRKARVAALDGSVIAASLDHAVTTAQVSVAQVWDVRRTLEIRTAALAAEHRSDAQAQELLAIVELMARNADEMEWMARHDIAFHRVIAEASGNVLFGQIIASFAPLMEVAVPTAWRTRESEDQRRSVLDQHRDVARAIADRAPAQAQAAMEAHFDLSIGRAARRLEGLEVIAVAGVEANRASSPVKTAWPLIVLMLTMISAAATRASLSPLQEVVKTDLGLDDFRMSLVQGLAASLPIALLSLPIGRLVDRTSRVRLLFAMALVWTVGELLTAFAHGFAVLFLARTLAGLGAVCALPAAISVAADLSSSERRGRALLLLSLGVSVGTALAFLVGGSLFQAFGGRTGSVRGLAAWRAVHLLFAAASGLLALLLLLVREPIRREVGVDSQAPLRVALAELWSRRAWLAPLFVGQIGVVMADTAAGVWAAPLLTRVYGLQPGQFAGWMGLVIFVPGLLGAVIGGVLADVGQRRRLFGGILFGAVAASALAIPFSLFSAAPSVTVFALMLSGFLFCGAVAGLVTATAIAVLTPNETRGVSLGAFVVLSGIVGLGLAPTLVTLVSAALGGDSHLGIALAVTSLVVSLVSFGGFGLAASRGATTA